MLFFLTHIFEKLFLGEAICSSRQVAYVTEWELIYHKAISNCFEELTKPSSSSSDAVILNRELSNTKISEYNESVTKVVSSISSLGNPHTTSASSRLYHFTTGQLVSPGCTGQWLKFFRRCFLMDALILEREQISQKRAPSSSKTAQGVSKELGKAQKAIDVARSRGISMKEILQFDLITTSSLFDDDMTSKPHKHTIMKELENHLANEDFLFDSTISLETVIIVDVHDQESSVH